MGGLELENKIYLVIDDTNQIALEEQFETQGYKLGDKKDYEKLIEETKNLYINGILTGKERNRCFRKILKEMFSDSELIESI